MFYHIVFPLYIFSLTGISLTFPQSYAAIDIDRRVLPDPEVLPDHTHSPSLRKLASHAGPAPSTHAGPAPPTHAGPPSTHAGPPSTHAGPAPPTHAGPPSTHAWPPRYSDGYQRKDPKPNANTPTQNPRPKDVQKSEIASPKPSDPQWRKGQDRRTRGDSVPQMIIDVDVTSFPFVKVSGGLGDDRRVQKYNYPDIIPQEWDGAQPKTYQEWYSRTKDNEKRGARPSPIGSPMELNGRYHGWYEKKPNLTQWRSIEAEEYKHLMKNKKWDKKNDPMTYDNMTRDYKEFDDRRRFEKERIKVDLKNPMRPDHSGKLSTGIPNEIREDIKYEERRQKRAAKEVRREEKLLKASDPELYKKTKRNAKMKAKKEKKEYKVQKKELDKWRKQEKNNVKTKAKENHSDDHDPISKKSKGVSSVIGKIFRSESKNEMGALTLSPSRPKRTTLTRNSAEEMVRRTTLTRNSAEQMVRTQNHDVNNRRTEIPRYHMRRGGIRRNEGDETYIVKKVSHDPKGGIYHYERHYENTAPPSEFIHLKGRLTDGELGTRSFDASEAPRPIRTPFRQTPYPSFHGSSSSSSSSMEEERTYFSRRLPPQSSSVSDSVSSDFSSLSFVQPRGKRTLLRTPRNVPIINAESSTSDLLSLSSLPANGRRRRKQKYTPIGEPAITSNMERVFSDVSSVSSVQPAPNSVTTVRRKRKTTGTIKQSSNLETGSPVKKNKRRRRTDTVRVY